MKHQIKKIWTKEDENVLRRLYPESSCDAVAEYLGRTSASVWSKACKMKIAKYKNSPKRGMATGNINLIHKDNIVRQLRMVCNSDLVNAVTGWYNEIRPSLKRGETITLQIQLDKTA